MKDKICLLDIVPLNDPVKESNAQINSSCSIDDRLLRRILIRSSAVKGPWKSPILLFLLREIEGFDMII